MGATQLRVLVGTAIRPRATVVAAPAWSEGAPVLYLTPLRGRAAKGAASLGPLAAVERLTSAGDTAFGLAPLGAFVRTTRHATRCRPQGRLRQR